MHIRLAKLSGPAKLNKVLCKQRDDFSHFPAGRVILITSVALRHEADPVQLLRLNMLAHV